MYKLYSITKEKSKIRGFWQENGKGKIYIDKIKIENLSGEALYFAKKALFASGEKAVFYRDFESAIIESASGEKEVLRHCIKWQEKTLRPSLVKALLVQHNGITVHKNENGFTLELWKE